MNFCFFLVWSGMAMRCIQLYNSIVVCIWVLIDIIVMYIKMLRMRIWRNSLSLFYDSICICSLLIYHIWYHCPFAIHMLMLSNAKYSTWNISHKNLLQKQTTFFKLSRCESMAITKLNCLLRTKANKTNAK